MGVQPSREQWSSPERSAEDIEAEQARTARAVRRSLERARGEVPQATPEPPAAGPETPLEFPGGMDREGFFDAQPVEYT